ncbi:myeloid leukemia factor 2 [Tetranychus urticae]|uniref:Myeloid leukemia factor n=1 Tax=Tetranychus urticae TaxID=32264 RepID=T1K4S9_TETUR|nr:myeloid leukemia factor 2 [Tetranychus urticae]
MALMGFGDFNDMFGHVDRMMNNIMRNMFNPMPDPFGMMDTMMPGLTNIATFPNMTQGGSYFSSSVMHISNDGSGRPQVYQATQSARYGPDGVKETQETVRDSASGLQKMAIGHHINDRGHVMEKSKNWYTGEEEEKDEFINLDEEEGQAFEDEWKTRMGSAYAQRRGYHADRALTSSQGSAPLAITAGPSTSGESSSSHYYPQQQHQSRHLHGVQLPHQHHHHHQRTNNHHQYRGEMNATNSRCDPDIEIISAPSRVQHHHQSAAGSSPQTSNRHRVSAKQRSKKDKKPYKRSSNKNNNEQQH